MSTQIKKNGNWVTVAGGTRMWVGTKAALQAALDAGELVDGTAVMVTDDYEEASHSHPHPDWANAVTITALPFTAPDDGTLVLTVGTTSAYGGRNFYIDDIKVGEYQSTVNSVGSISTLTFPICKGQVLSSKGAYVAVWGTYKFVPWK